MKILKVNEVVDRNLNIIGDDDMPPMTDQNSETASNGHTDDNMQKSTQPYRFDMMGRFGFNLLPFFEDDNQETEEQMQLLTELTELMYEKYIDIIKYYHDKPKELKSDYEKHKKGGFKFDSKENDKKKVDKDWAVKVLKLIAPHIEKELKKIDESLLSKKDEKKEVIKKDDTVKNELFDKKQEVKDLVSSLSPEGKNKLLKIIKTKKES